LNSPLQPFSLIPPPLIPGVVSTDTVFAFTYMYTFYCTISALLPPFPNTSPLPCQPSTLGRTCSAFLFSNFVEEKKRKDKMKNMVFQLKIKVDTQGVSL
jgi:hypothetical protein